MNINRDLVNKFAKDLLIELTDEENEMVLEEFEIIEENMEKINNLPNISEEEAMTHPFEVIVDLREDEIGLELEVEEVLQNAKNKTEEEVIVPRVVE